MHNSIWYNGYWNDGIFSSSQCVSTGSTNSGNCILVGRLEITSNWYDGQFYGGYFYGNFNGGTFHYGYLNGVYYSQPFTKLKPFFK
jgi:hypothetical protein